MSEPTNNLSAGATATASEEPVDRLFIIKIGGNVIDDDKSLAAFLDELTAVKGKKILVHGGGKIATGIGSQLGIVPNYVNGRRITDAATIDLVTMVYGGLVNKKIVAQLQCRGINAIGLTGADGNSIPAVQRPVKDIDYGFVGDVQQDKINAGFISMLLNNNCMPVFAPLTHNGRGRVLNTNADTIAQVLAVALCRQYKVRLVYCFEKKGVLENVEDDNSVVTLITKKIYAYLLDNHKLADGILPKIDNAFAAIDKGVQEVIIGDAKDLLLNTGERMAGTLILG